jgi:hypothetical protein
MIMGGYKIHPIFSAIFAMNSSLLRGGEIGVSARASFSLKKGSTVLP